MNKETELILFWLTNESEALQEITQLTIMSQLQLNLLCESISDYVSDLHPWGTQSLRDTTYGKLLDITLKYVDFTRIARHFIERVMSNPVYAAKVTTQILQSSAKETQWKQ